MSARSFLKGIVDRLSCSDEAKSNLLGLWEVLLEIPDEPADLKTPTTLLLLIACSVGFLWLGGEDLKDRQHSEQHYQQLITP